jgi:hypothetical protein
MLPSLLSIIIFVNGYLCDEFHLFDHIGHGRFDYINR